MIVHAPYESAEPRRKRETVQARREVLRTRFKTTVQDRFERISGQVLAVSYRMLASPVEEEAREPTHPQCAECAQTDLCGSFWQARWSDPVRVAEAPWRQCIGGRWCCQVPVTWNRRTFATCRLVCETERTSLHRYAELLDVLLQNFHTVERSAMMRAEVTDSLAITLPPPTPPGSNPEGWHSAVKAAVQFIDDHLSDPTLNVARVAKELGINSTYLSHIFSEELGTRMSRFIAGRRVELAKRLLVSTNWQVKRIAFESGHNNADWFSQVFHAHAGITPCDYRRQVRQAAGASGP